MDAEVIKYLDFLRIPISKDFIKIRLQSHPNYPSVISIEDTLDEIGIKSEACCGTIQDLEAENRPFLAHFNHEGGQVKFFKNVSSARGKMKDFEKIWSGNVVFIAKGVPNGNKTHETFRKKEKLYSFLKISITCLFALAYLFTVLYFKSIVVGIFVPINCCGLYISWLIAQKEVGVKSKISDKICGFIQLNKCEAVLLSKGALVTRFLSWGDIGLVYFTSSIVFLYVFQALGFSSTALYVLNILGLLFPFYSLYYQIRVIKQLCMLCICVLLVLLLNAIVTMFLFDFNEIKFKSQVEQLAVFSFFSLLSYFIWRLFIAIYRNKNLAVQNEIALNKLKRSKRYFDALFEKQEFNKANMPLLDEPIYQGDKAAKLNLVVACNPYCRPCAHAHENLEELIDRFPSIISLTTRFTLETNDDGPRLRAADQIINLIKVGSKTAVRSWYQTGDLQKFKALNPTPQFDNHQILEQHMLWTKVAKITSTPTIFLNGKKIPEEYNWLDFVNLLRMNLKSVS